MSEKQSLRVEVQAAMALAEWKSLFAETVCAEAKELAKLAASNTITLAHYREAAGIALISLTNAIPNLSANGSQKAA
jgi:hypothetical protein